MLKATVFLVTLAGIISLVFILALLFAYPTMWIVNYLFSAQLLSFVFGVSKLTIWKAFVLNMFFGTVVGKAGTLDSSKKS